MINKKHDMHLCLAQGHFSLEGWNSPLQWSPGQCNVPKYFVFWATIMPKHKCPGMKVAKKTKELGTLHWPGDRWSGEFHPSRLHLVSFTCLCLQFELTWNGYHYDRSHLTPTILWQQLKFGWVEFGCDNETDLSHLKLPIFSEHFRICLWFVKNYHNFWIFISVFKTIW